MKDLLFICLLFCGLSSTAQKKAEVDIVAIIDDLTVRWDETAIRMKNYQGIQEFCLTPEYRKTTIKLLDNIHHWDTTLYFIVQEKFDTSKDKEAAATLEDIEELETEYSTANFKKFITDECGMLKVIQDNFDQETVKQYEKDIRKFEKELVKYLNSITYRIDIIDEHIHHLDF
ncbi:hypothetical protein AAOE16_02360 [Ekhidna sp. MALMAid0563]|uniref:hypothetical protein n=1 Tax=Ekhidna sp. MALMAid0563 TaxID=3143937 RepID=UPI0032E02653